jgi:hypothetical protein
MCSWSNLRHHPSFCLDRKTRKIPGHEIGPTDRNLKLRLAQKLSRMADKLTVAFGDSDLTVPVTYCHVSGVP